MPFTKLSNCVARQRLCAGVLGIYVAGLMLILNNRYFPSDSRREKCFSPRHPR